MKNYIFKAKAALVGDELTYTENVCIFVRDGTIELVGPADGAKAAAADYETVDLGDRVLMPGMIDSHSHTSLDARVAGHLEMMTDPAPDLTIRAVNNMRDDIMSGITTVRILGDKEYVDVSVRRAVNAGEIPGPRMLIAGIGMRSLHGHGFVGVPHTGAQEFRQTCRQNMLRKVDWLKIFVTAGAPPAGSGFIPSYVSLEEIETVSGEAKRNGLRTSAHCIGGEGLINCVKGGIDVIDHAYCATDADLELIAEAGRFVCLTPSVFMDLERNTKNPANVAKNTELGRDRAVGSMRKIVRSGVRYAVGSDALHANMPLEAKYAVELGASYLEALKGITVWGAELCGIADRTGSIKEGKAADLIAVPENPLDDLDALRKVSLVVKDGIIIKNEQGGTI